METEILGSFTLNPETIQDLLSKIEPVLGHTFLRHEVLIEALTHSSFSNERATAELKLPDNERFEYLGDAVIGLVVAESLMNLFPSATEGKLSRLRSHLVSRKTLSELALQFKMNEWILLGRGEARTGGATKRSILAGLFESVIGALYVDSGIEVARRFLNLAYQEQYKLMETDTATSRHLLDIKTFLQEKTQSRFRTTPVYQLVETWGPEHEKFFKVEVQVDGKVIAEGQGKSKKDAEQEAARLAMERLEL